MTFLKQFVVIGIAFYCLAGSSGKAFAWNESGHMLVAQIAYGRLNVRAKAEVNKLLTVPIPPEDVTRRDKSFVRAAVWADDIRGNDAVPDTGSWDYIDSPFGITPATKIPAGLVGQKNIVFGCQNLQDQGRFNDLPELCEELQRRFHRRDTIQRLRQVSRS